MAQFQVQVLIHAPASVVWTRLTDWSAHARLAPLTTIRVIGSGDRPGSGFVSRTGIGPLAFDDPMEIEEFEPPTEPMPEAEAGTGAESASKPADPTTGSLTKPVRPLARFRIRKTGWLLRGWVVAELWPAADRSGPDRIPVTGPAAVDQAQTPVPPNVTRLIWTEELRLPLEGVTRFAGPLVAAVARAGYGAALRKLGREIEGDARG